MYRGQRISVVIPALNEQQAIAHVINDLWKLEGADGQSVIDEVVVCDNGSTDNTAQVSFKAGAKIVFQKQPGYGIACLTAIGSLHACDIVLFVDADDSCFIPQGIPLLDAIADGADLAIGSRTLGKMEEGALTGVQLFGNGLSSFLIRLLWKQPITDLGPFRAIKYSVLKQLNMLDERFGWTVEMQVKTIQHQFITVECPVDSKVRIGESKISGTLKGAIGAGFGILSMIAKLRLRQSNYLATHGRKTTKALDN
jgi:glycosyltransferase involved in cell wall biosynthesis